MGYKSKENALFIAIHPATYRSGRFLAHGVLNKYGNAFISEDIKRLWRNDDLGGYLSSTTGRPVKIRECRQMKNGCVAEIDYKAEHKTQ